MISVAVSKIAVIGGLTQERIASRGEVYEGTIILQNMGDEPQAVRLYQTDYRYFADGTVDYGNPGQNPRSNASWINYSPRQLTLVAGERATINYIVTVPDDLTIVGTYWSLMMVEPVPEIVPEELEKGLVGIREVTRYGIQMRTHINDTGIKELTFLNSKLFAEDSSRVFQIDLENTGERRLDVLLWVDLYDLQGNHMGKFEADNFSFYPTTSVRKQIDLSDVPVGMYKALIIADGGEDALFGANYTFKIEE